MNKMSTTEKLVKFVNQKPRLDFKDYGDITAYRAESREITNDKHDFFELLSLAQRRDSDFDGSLTAFLQTTGGRLLMNESGELQYTTGQYFPTEYRPAANNVLKYLIWKSYMQERDEKGEKIYKDGQEIRKAIKRNLSRRVSKLYFN